MERSLKLQPYSDQLVSFGFKKVPSPHGPTCRRYLGAVTLSFFVRVGGLKAVPRRDLISWANESLVNHIDLHRLVSGDEFGLVLVTAVVCGLQLVPEDVAVFVRKPLIDRGCHDLADDHEAVEPLFGPFDLALKVTPALRYAGRFDGLRWDGCESGFI